MALLAAMAGGMQHSFGVAPGEAFEASLSLPSEKHAMGNDDLAPLLVRRLTAMAATVGENATCGEDICDPPMHATCGEDICDPPMHATCGDDICQPPMPLPPPSIPPLPPQAPPSPPSPPSPPMLPPLPPMAPSPPTCAADGDDICSPMPLCFADMDDICAPFPHGPPSHSGSQDLADEPRDKDNVAGQVVAIVIGALILIALVSSPVWLKVLGCLGPETPEVAVTPPVAVTSTTSAAAMPSTPGQVEALADKPLRAEESMGVSASYTVKRKLPAAIQRAQAAQAAAVAFTSVAASAAADRVAEVSATSASPMSSALDWVRRQVDADSAAGDQLRT